MLIQQFLYLLGSEDYGLAGSPNPLFSCGGNHSLMAPHDEGNSTLCTSDLQALFELAEILFDQENVNTS